MNVETEITPPDTEEDGEGDDRSTRITCHVIGSDEVSYDAAVQLFADSANDPKLFADGLLNVALAVAALRGSDYSWAVMARFAAYDGMAPR